MSTTIGKVIDTRAPVTIQLGILCAIIVGVWRGGAYAERAESKLAAIERATGANTTALVDLTSAVNTVNASGSKALAAHKVEATALQVVVDRRLTTLEACLKKGRRCQI